MIQENSYVNSFYDAKMKYFPPHISSHAKSRSINFENKNHVYINPETFPV